MEVDADEDSNQSASLLQPIEETMVDELCNHITLKVFGIPLDHLANSEPVLQAVASCVDMISSLLEPEGCRVYQDDHNTNSTSCAGGSDPAGCHNDGDLGANNPFSSHPSKKRKYRDFDGSDDQSNANDGLGKSNPSIKTPANAKLSYNFNFICPYRRRNPAKFNIRDHRTCAWRPFQSMSQLK